VADFFEQSDQIERTGKRKEIAALRAGVFLIVFATVFAIFIAVLASVKMTSKEVYFSRK
jgi:hypothetical protein